MTCSEKVEPGCVRPDGGGRTRSDWNEEMQSTELWRRKMDRRSPAECIDSEVGRWRSVLRHLLELHQPYSKCLSNGPSLICD